jgi:mono/diheme cytochrome c family protein
LAALAAAFENGRQTYVAMCARCHGEDGRSRDYNLIKTLDGIGNRLSRQQVRAALSPAPAGRDTYLVRSQPMDEPTLDALVAYVTGL